MASSFYVNMEPLALKIAKDAISAMEDNLIDNNVPECRYLDDKKIENNLRYGFIALTMMAAFVESFLNTVLRDCIGKSNDKNLRESFNRKISLICQYYHIPEQDILGGTTHLSFEKVRGLRNSLVHYKFQLADEGLGIKDLAINKTSKPNETYSFKVEFTQSAFSQMLEDVEGLCNKIAEQAGLKINLNTGVVECDARDGLTSFVFDPKLTVIDPTRILGKSIPEERRINIIVKTPYGDTIYVKTLVHNSEHVRSIEHIHAILEKELKWPKTIMLQYARDTQQALLVYEAQRKNGKIDWSLNFETLDLPTAFNATGGAPVNVIAVCYEVDVGLGAIDTEKALSTIFQSIRAFSYMARDYFSPFRALSKKYDISEEYIKETINRSKVWGVGFITTDNLKHQKIIEDSIMRKLGYQKIDKQWVSRVERPTKLPCDIFKEG